MIIETSASFTRPNDTTAYTANDLIANSTTAGSVVAMTFNLPQTVKGLKILRAGVKFNSATPTNAKFKLHLYRSSPTASNGDNSAWLTTESGYLDNIAIDASTLTFSDNTTGFGTYVNTAVGVPLCVTSISGQIFGLLQATAAYTPTANEVFTVTLQGEVLD